MTPILTTAGINSYSYRNHARITAQDDALEFSRVLSA